MLIRTSVISLVIILTAALTASAQRTELSLTINEQFFDALLDTTFNNYDPPAFPIGLYSVPANDGRAFAFSSLWGVGNSGPSTETFCDSSIKILRETNGVRTAVRFREGKTYVPLAFTGSYAAPLIGCVEFSGTAESVVDLEYQAASRRLIGNVRVLSVDLNGTRGIGGTLVAKLIQGSIDRKFNPVEILTLDKLSFGLPIPNTGKIDLFATGVRPEIINGSMIVHIDYEFRKG